MYLSQPQYLWLFALLVPLAGWYIWKHRRLHASMSVSTISPLAKMGTPWRVWLQHLRFVLRLLCLGCVIIILCRPQVKDSWRTTTTEGTDIMMALDISSSMLARDFQPDRIGAAKKVAQDFVAGRPDDNIGLVIFAGESLTGMPMTMDHAQLINYIDGVNVDMLQDGTAIGDGIATSINRLRDGQAKSKSIILITDGSNNTGIVSPLSAAAIAKEMGIKIYTIGVGRNGSAPYPAIDAFGRMTFPMTPVVIDEGTLRNIASETGGTYFRATGNESLKEIFAEIEKLDKTTMDVRHFSHVEDNYMLWAWLALALLALDLLMRYTILRSIP